MTQHTPSNPRLHAAIALAALSTLPPLSHAAGTEVFRDDFNTSSFDTSKWSLAAWPEPHDRTQWGPSPLTPTLQNGYATLTLNTYNPASPGTYLQGTEIVSKSPFSLNTGMEFETRLRTNTTTPGIITAFYTYGTHGTNPTLSDETDFEFASNDNSPHPATGDQVYLTNWNDWSTGSSSTDTTKHSFTHPTVPNLNVNTFNTLLVRWLPDRTEWYINNALVRTTTQAVPTDPMNLIFNIWAPDSSWPSAYSSSLQPTANPSANTSHTMDVDYAVVRQIPANTWTLPTSGTWSTPTNWNTAPTTSANFLNIPNSPTTVTLDSPKTLSTLTFDSPNSYTLAGSATNTLTLSSTLTVNSGSHTLSAPLLLSNNTTANIAANSTLSITTSLTAPTITLTKSTGTGTLQLPAFRLNTLTVTAGTVQLLPNLPTAAKLNTLSVTTGTLDLTNNSLVLDYSSTTPADTLRIRLNQGRTASGTWTGPTGILSSTAASDPSHTTAIGYAEAKDVLNLTGTATSTWHNQPVDATTLLVTYTPYGDANLDGTVTPDDLAHLDRGFHKHLTGWSNGDFDYSGTIDSADYLLLDRTLYSQSHSLSPDLLSERESQFGATYVQALLTSIPEPSSAACLFAGFPLFIRTRRHTA